MASTSLRESFNSLGWSRRNDEPVNTRPQQSGLLSSIGNLNPFRGSGYVQLPTAEGPGAPLPAPTRREEEEGWFVRKSIWVISLVEVRMWVANVECSQSMGSSISIWRVQSRCPGLFRHLLHSLPRPLFVAPQICYLVSVKEACGMLSMFCLALRSLL
jgi:hypothetical protein